MASSKNRKAAALALAVVGVAGLSIASAATLNVGTSSLGAAQTIVEACQEDSDQIAIDFTNAYSSTVKGYTVSSVDLSGLTGCVGPEMNYQITLTKGDGSTLTELTGKGLTATKKIALTASVKAADVEGVAVVIYS
ncbi:hypothetical protein GCM10011331_22190 [Flavimobilis marinus]|uniref:Uncharacterized protein n=1 Tax=Flavimobilis marinus TaxID=285351 RepID=A0A1I2GUK5_9MICO|nr:hypothetical protein [Flavimobilis marinus]GHG55479.1 hypothetical protein GCM10011331_22190 [Flavimobilis marinus]SFF20261.1 hypothetical protein SAMN04488035_1950 [Flavimobilis marinus]